MKFRPTIAVLSITILFLACRQRGPELADVQGIIALDGKPLARALVIFEPKTGGRASRAVSDDAGAYRLNYLRDANGALIGLHKVKITTASEDDPKERIPARYNKKSTLTADVVRGPNKHNFNLTSK
jgi:hypothetical protein